MPDIHDMRMDAYPTENDLYLEELQARKDKIMKKKQIIVQKMKRGNPNWYKGMPAVNPYGRNGRPAFMVLVEKGLKNFLSSPFT